MNASILIRNFLVLFLLVSAGWLIARDSLQRNGAPEDAGQECSLTDSSGGCTSCAACGPAVEPQTASAAAASSQTSTAALETVVYYFHGTARCVTCKTIEAMAKEIINRHFSKELSSRLLSFESINLDDPANKHFIRDFQLSVRSVVAARYKDKNLLGFHDLKEVWTKVRNPTDFESYLKYGISSLMEKYPK